MLMGKTGQPVVLCAPEGEQVAREMSVWEDVRLVPDFLCVTVPDAIDYPFASYTSFHKLAGELRNVGELKRLRIALWEWAICRQRFLRIFPIPLHVSWQTALKYFLI